MKTHKAYFSLSKFDARNRQKLIKMTGNALLERMQAWTLTSHPLWRFCIGMEAAQLTPLFPSNLSICVFYNVYILFCFRPAEQHLVLWTIKLIVFRGSHTRLARSASNRAWFTSLDSQICLRCWKSFKLLCRPNKQTLVCWKNGDSVKWTLVQFACGMKAKCTKFWNEGSRAKRNVLCRLLSKIKAGWC